MLGQKQLIEIRANEYQIRLLDKESVQNDRLYWQIINIIIPLTLILALGIVWNWRRKRKYT